MIFTSIALYISFNFDVSSYCELMLLILPVFFRQILLAQGGGGGL
jgi:hypothetical protein